jgi:transketolase
LPIAAGMAFANKILKKKGKIYVLISDGECQEGTTWETLLVAAKHKLDNLIILIDYNKIQALSKLNDALPLHNLVKKIQSFNINCVDVKNGHNFSSILKSFKLKNKKKLPIAIIFNTIKGKGVKEFENDPVWHARKLSKEELVIAKKRLGF